jgi:hypothetical protein
MPRPNRPLSAGSSTRFRAFGSGRKVIPWAARPLRSPGSPSSDGRTAGRLRAIRFLGSPGFPTYQEVSPSGEVRACPAREDDRLAFRSPAWRPLRLRPERSSCRSALQRAAVPFSGPARFRPSACRRGAVRGSEPGSMEGSVRTCPAQRVIPLATGPSGPVGLTGISIPG